jgi:hypothetical protein
MRVPVIREGMISLVFDEEDVRQTCRMLKCRKGSDDCMALMSNQMMQCVACYAALRILNRPFGIRINRYAAEQRN